MKVFRLNAVPTILGMFVGLLFTANAFGSDINVADLLFNPDFEFGSQVPRPGDIAGCPVFWTCGGSPSPGATSYAPTTAEFVPGSDGLFGPFPAPSGARVALCPTYIGGSCLLSQTNLGTYAADNTYTLDLFVGTPAVMPFDVFGNVDDHTRTGRAQRITFYWVGNGNGQLQAVDIAPPPPGQWIDYQLRFTPKGSQVGQKIGIIIFASSGNYQPVVFDIPHGQ